MIFRSEMCRRQKNVANAERDNRNISVIAGICWEKLPPAERKPYEHLAQIAKERHAAENPGYKYTPTLPSRSRRARIWRTTARGVNELLWNG
jgi:HMG (high mobility group) box